MRPKIANACADTQGVNSTVSEREKHGRYLERYGNQSWYSVRECHTCIVEMLFRERKGCITVFPDQSCLVIWIEGQRIRQQKNVNEETRVSNFYLVSLTATIVKYTRHHSSNKHPNFLVRVVQKTMNRPITTCVNRIDDDLNNRLSSTSSNISY